MTQCIIHYNYDRREILEIDYQRENSLSSIEVKPSELYGKLNGYPNILSDLRILLVIYRHNVSYTMTLQEMVRSEGAIDCYFKSVRTNHYYRVHIIPGFIKITSSL